MFTSDPDFVMGKIMTNTFQVKTWNHFITITILKVFGVKPNKCEEPRKKLIDFSKSSQAAKITPLEKLHLEAALLIAEEDFKYALATYEKILKSFPRDAHALNMGYFLAMQIGQTAKLRY